LRFITGADDDRIDFAIRERSLPPPRTGRIIDEPFPPAPINEAAVDSAAGPLEVLRFAPEGDVEMAPHLSVTFSQPMVAVASNEDLAASQPPVKLSPQPKGRWRWVGTKTLLFEPDGRFPMATEYKATPNFVARLWLGDVFAGSQQFRGRSEDGTWRIKAGARVRVRLTMVAPANRYHVALVDPLPAGFETLNPELALTGHIPQDPDDQKDKWRWAWRWFEHQNMRDERVEAFTSLLWEGVYNYSYVARATTPGVFVVPPSKAEEMYHPETFGRGATDRVVIE
jgi:hypothetical protein